MRKITMGIAGMAWAMALGCGAAKGPPRMAEAPASGSATAAPVMAGTAPKDTPNPLAHARDLPADATYQNFVMQTRELLRRNAGGSTDGCLLGATRKGFDLRADLAPAVTPITDAPGDLDGRLENFKEAFRALSRWGQIGTTADRFVLATLTGTRPETTATALATVLTDRGIYVWSVGGDDGAGKGPLDQDGAAANLRARLSAQTVPVIITAEAAVPMATVYRWLQRVGAAGAEDVSLAVVLPEGTKMPEPVSTKSAPAAHCAAGLPATKEPQGELSREELTAAIKPMLTRDAAACLAHGEASESRGGRVVMATRIGRQGQVTEACIVESEFEGSAVESCLIDAMQRMLFPSPKGGVVDVMVPIRLSPDASLRQAPVCVQH